MGLVFFVLHRRKFEKHSLKKTGLKFQVRSIETEKLQVNSIGQKKFVFELKVIIRL